MNVYLVKMTRSLMHEFFRSFTYDPEAIADTDQTQVYHYSKETVEKLYDKHTAQGKIHFAIMLNDQIIGDIYLKHIDSVTESCEMGIHIMNDEYKGKGYGTQAERLILSYAFKKLNMQTVYADTLIKNKRSAHVLEKVGFIEISRNNNTIHFVHQKCRWNAADSFDTLIIS